MCGRFVSRADAATEQYWSLLQPWPQGFASWNVSPGRDIPVVMQREGRRAGAYLRWGLVPFWAKGEVPRYSTINARLETLERAASYRAPWARGQRCIVPVEGFYEWQITAEGKQPWFIRLLDGQPFGLAGLWDRSAGADAPGIQSCTIITLPANPLVARIHAKGRMPAILTAEQATVWLEASPQEAHSVLAPRAMADMEAWPVSRRVNTPRNDDASLVSAVGETVRG